LITFFAPDGKQQAAGKKELASRQNATDKCRILHEQSALTLRFSHELHFVEQRRRVPQHTPRGLLLRGRHHLQRRRTRPKLNKENRGFLDAETRPPRPRRIQTRFPAAYAHFITDG